MTQGVKNRVELREFSSNLKMNLMSDQGVCLRKAKQSTEEETDFAALLFFLSLPLQFYYFLYFYGVVN